MMVACIPEVFVAYVRMVVMLLQTFTLAFTHVLCAAWSKTLQASFRSARLSLMMFENQFTSVYIIGMRGCHSGAVRSLESILKLWHLLNAKRARGSMSAPMDAAQSRKYSDL